MLKKLDSRPDTIGALAIENKLYKTAIFIHESNTRK